MPFFVLFFVLVNEKQRRAEKGASAKQTKETNKTQIPLTKLTTIILKTITNKQTKTYQQMSEQTDNKDNNKQRNLQENNWMKLEYTTDQH